MPLTRGLVSEDRPIALILPKRKMAQLPHYVPLIDGSLSQPAQETVKKLSCQSGVDSSRIYQREMGESNLNL